MVKQDITLWVFSELRSKLQNHNRLQFFINGIFGTDAYQRGSTNTTVVCASLEAKVPPCELTRHGSLNIAHLRQQCHNSKFVTFQEKCLKVLKCYHFLWGQTRHNWSPAASFANCVMTLYLSKVHLQTFLSIPISQKCQILSYDTLVENELYNKRQLLSC